MNNLIDKIEMWMFLYVTAAFTSVLLQFLIKLIYRSI